jgi:hypothetical protein
MLKTKQVDTMLYTSLQCIVIYAAEQEVYLIAGVCSDSRVLAILGASLQVSVYNTVRIGFHPLIHTCIHSIWYAHRQRRCPSTYEINQICIERNTHVGTLRLRPDTV